MNILSLCDGMSCGQIALKELGVTIDNYYASEIDKNAIKVTMDNFPETKQIGDVTKISDEMVMFEDEPVKHGLYKFAWKDKKEVFYIVQEAYGKERAFCYSIYKKQQENTKKSDRFGHKEREGIYDR